MNLVSDVVHKRKLLTAAANGHDPFTLDKAAPARAMVTSRRALYSLSTGLSGATNRVLAIGR
jgi:hypothetical protein